MWMFLFFYFLLNNYLITDVFLYISTAGWLRRFTKAGRRPPREVSGGRREVESRQAELIDAAPSPSRRRRKRANTHPSLSRSLFYYLQTIRNKLKLVWHIIKIKTRFFYFHLLIFYLKQLQQQHCLYTCIINK